MSILVAHEVTAPTSYTEIDSPGKCPLVRKKVRERLRRRMNETANDFTKQLMGIGMRALSLIHNLVQSELFKTK